MKSKLRGSLGLCVGLLFVLLPGCSEEKSPEAEKGGAGAKVEGGKKDGPATPVPEEEAAAEESVVDDPKDDVPEEVEVGPVVRWTDEVGNFVKFSDNPALVNPDIVGVDALSKDGKLVVVYRFAPGNLEQCIAQKNGDPPTQFGSSISELYLDVDDDPGTGVELGEGENEQGYELNFSVMRGFSFVNADSGEADALFGDVGLPENATNLKADASQVTLVLDPAVEERGTWATLSRENQDADSRRLTVLGKDLVAVYLPYEWFGMKSGEVIRLAFTDEKGEDGGMSEAKRVKLK